MNNQAQTKRCLHVFILNFFASLILFSSNKVKSIGMVFLLTVLFLSNACSSSIDQALISKLLDDRSISEEFISHLKTEYNASSGLLVLHSPCKVLVQKNDKRIAREIEKPKNQTDKRSVWDELMENAMNNPFAKSMRYEHNCDAMLSRASVIAKTISGVKSTDVLR